MEVDKLRKAVLLFFLFFINFCFITTNIVADIIKLLSIAIYFTLLIIVYHYNKCI